MNEQKNEWLRQVVGRTARHSQQFKLNDYSYRELPADIVEDIGSQLVNFYEYLADKYVEDSRRGTPSTTGAASDSHRQRKHGRQFPYR